MVEQEKTEFPLGGVIGVVANGPDEIDMGADKALQCLEVRADLLLSKGLSEPDLMALISRVRAQGVGCLFTLRHPTHGGVFQGSEQERIKLSQQALDAGADMIDLEWKSQAAESMLARQAPMILSHHDFERMIDGSELTDLTQQMRDTGAWAIKVVPTADRLVDAVTMLNWVHSGNADSETTRHIGFAMGDAGACSRILTLSRGAPITYASFGEVVAPGQVAIDDLFQNYRVQQIDSRVRIIAICGGDEAKALAQERNKAFAINGDNTVAIAFQAATKDELKACVDALQIEEIIEV